MYLFGLCRAILSYFRYLCKSQPLLTLLFMLFSFFSLAVATSIPFPTLPIQIHIYTSPELIYFSNRSQSVKVCQNLFARLVSYVKYYPAKQMWPKPLLGQFYLINCVFQNGNTGKCKVCRFLLTRSHTGYAFDVKKRKR